MTQFFKPTGDVLLITSSDVTYSSESVGVAYPHRFLSGHFPNTDSREPELFYCAHFWTLRANAFFNTVTTVFHNLERTVQPLAACNSGRLFIWLSNIPAWQLSQSVPGSMSSFHSNFWVILYSSRFLPENNAWRTSYLLILLSWCFDFNVSAAHCPNVHSETKYLKVQVCLALFLWHPAQMEDFKQMCEDLNQ